MRILAIETSCDDTGVAILETGTTKQPKLLADFVSSQVKIHAPWGGVVPMLAKREHQRNLLPLLKQALKESRLLKISKFYPERSPNSKFQTLNSILEREPELLKKLTPFLKKYQKPDIDYIAVTIGPGLEPALWVGVNFARALAYFWDLPIIPVNHVEAHIGANFIPPRRDKISAISDKLFPAIALIVSGGHTQLILIKKFGQYDILGETRDDAAGEAFDKLAKMLNLGYPGGPVIAAEAAKFKIKKLKLKIKELPRPMINSDDFDFSFSGLKTAALYLIKKLTKAQAEKLTPAICAQFQQAAIDVLVAKTIKAAKKFGAKAILLSGGVAANDLLRESLSLNTKQLSLNFLVPPKDYCTDNAAMIAYTAYLNFTDKKKSAHNSWQSLKAKAILRIK